MCIVYGCPRADVLLYDRQQSSGIACTASMEDEQEHEQLDYDEEELISARMKAKELINLNQSTTNKDPLPVPADPLPPQKHSTLGPNSSNSSSLLVRPPFRCHINPKFNRQNQQHNSLSVSNFASSHYNSSMAHHQQQPNFLALMPTSVQQSIPQAYLPAFSNAFLLNAPAPAPMNHNSQMATNSHSNVYINPSVFNAANHASTLHQSHSTRFNWDMMVDEFVRRNASSGMRKYYSRSRSSASSSSYSSRSRSHSSSDSRESTQKRRRKCRSPIKRRYRTPETTERIKPRERHNTQTMRECAHAIGLDDEYLKKIEEQNKMREEVMRRKKQHRKEYYMDKAVYTAKTAGTTPPDEISSKTMGTSSKLRPYLAVVVTNLRNTQNADKKIAHLANSVGQTKKVWRVADDDCHVIFEKHEHAKQFMLQHHGKTMDNSRMDITLKKVFLNIASSA